ncbi:MAG: hypothetical protein KJ888_20255 [Gammaproteobacteria bacterium]|nr:hypothetical protein [Gammaproteobacteria bacterium]
MRKFTTARFEFGQLGFDPDNDVIFVNGQKKFIDKFGKNLRDILDFELIEEDENKDNIFATIFIENKNSIGIIRYYRSTYTRIYKVEKDGIFYMNVLNTVPQI